MGILRKILESINEKLINKKVEVYIKDMFPESGCVNIECLTDELDVNASKIISAIDDYITSVSEELYEKGIDVPYPTKIDTTYTDFVFDKWEYADEKDLKKMDIKKFVNEYLKNLDITTDYSGIKIEHL